MIITSIQIIINILLLFLIVLYILSITVITRVYSVITLILSYVIVSIIALLYMQPFIAIVLLMVYAGAISIFFIFMIMLLNMQQRGTGPIKLTLGSLMLFFLLLALLVQLVFENHAVLMSLDQGFFDVQAAAKFYDTKLSQLSVIVTMNKTETVAKVLVGSQLEQIGFALYTHFIYAFLGAGLLLLVAIIGVTSLFTSTPRLQKSRESDNLQVLRAFEKKNKCC